MQLGDDEALERPCSHFRVGGPVRGTAALVQLTGTSTHPGGLDGGHQVLEGIGHLRPDVRVLATFGDEATIATIDLGEIVVQGMKPFVRQGASTITLSQVDDGLSRLVVSRRCILATLPTGTEGQAQLAVQRQRTGWNADDRRQVGQSVIGIV